MKILVSACLLGVSCRYDGQSKAYPLIDELCRRHDVVPVCPEQLGGLPTPRCPCEIRDGRVTAAGCVLPLSDSNRLSADLGTRHRAGVGMSEATDAVVVIVSEETGAISVAVGGMLKRHLAPQTLERMLRNELCRDEQEDKDNLVMRLRQKLKKKEDGVHEK